MDGPTTELPEDLDLSWNSIISKLNNNIEININHDTFPNAGHFQPLHIIQNCNVKVV